MRQKRSQQSGGRGFFGFLLNLILILMLLAAGIVGLHALGWIQIEYEPVKQLLSWADFNNNGQNAASNNEDQDADETSSKEDQQGQNDAAADAPSGEQPQDTPAHGPEESTTEQPAATQPEPAEQPAGTREGVLATVSGTVAADDGQRALLMQLDGMKIASRGVLSIEDWLSEAEISEPASYNWVLSQMSSLIYEAALRSGLEPVERYLHDELPEGMKPGFDVRYEHGKRNFSIYNPTDHEVYLQLAFDNQQATLSIRGVMGEDWQQPAIRVSAPENFAPETILVVDHQNRTGRTVARPGREGLLVKVYRKIGDEPEELVAKDYYAPQPELITVPPVSQVGTGQES